jgi:hypothetical protein
VVDVWVGAGRRDTAASTGPEARDVPQCAPVSGRMHAGSAGDGTPMNTGADSGVVQRDTPEGCNGR